MAAPTLSLPRRNIARSGRVSREAPSGRSRHRPGPLAGAIMSIDRCGPGLNRRDRDVVRSFTIERHLDETADGFCR
jgi:hypothetical protein